MSLDSTIFVQLVIFVLFGLPLLAIPWLLLVWLIRKLFCRKDKDNG